HPSPSCQGVLPNLGVGGVPPHVRGSIMRQREVNTRLSTRPAADPPLYRAIVTGAAGFIGSHLVEALLEQGHEVVGVDAFTPSYPSVFKRANIAWASAHPRFDLLPADLNELALDEVLCPGDVLFHRAGRAGVRASWGQDFVDCSTANAEATERVLEAALKRQAARVVLASSSSVYGDAPLPMQEDGPLLPVSPYGVSKLTAELLGRVYWKALGLPIVALRLFTVYGPRQRPDMAFHGFIDAIAHGQRVVLFGDRSQRRDLTFVRDIVTALLPAPSPPGERVSEGRAAHVLLYSHDTYGLGHLRRNTTIAHGLRQRAPQLHITLLTGSPVADQWPLPEGVSLVHLPPVVKVGPDEY